MYLREKMTESKMSTHIPSPRAMSMMHEWTSVNGWSRPASKDEHGLRAEVSGSRSQLALRRCQTNMEKQQVYRPHRRQHCDSCTVDFIRHLENLNKETEAKLKNTMQVIALQRSRTDLDSRDSPGSSLISSLFRERTHMYLTNIQALSRHREPAAQTNKQELKIGVAVVPRRGLIALQTAQTGIYNQPQVLSVQGTRRQLTNYPPESGTVRTRSLIKRSDILQHIKHGNKLLEDAEETKHKEEEITKGLGDYTILDLQSELMEMTDTKTVKRQQSTVAKTDPASQPRNFASISVNKSLTLPAIKNINPFKL